MALGALLQGGEETAGGEREPPSAMRVACAPAAASTDVLDFEELYNRWFDHVCRWLRAHGIPAHDREDVAQEVFLIAQRKLPSFEGTHYAPWLYNICKYTASNHRRSAWFKNMFRKSPDFQWDLSVDERANPEDSAASREAVRQVSAALSRMPKERRSAFVLFEIEGYSGEEIAAFEQIPVATVWSRLHYARKEFRAYILATEKGR